MKQLVSQILHSSFVQNVGKLLSANIIAQVIGIVIYPILTRMYAPEDFALLSLFMSIAGVLVLIGTFEYQYAIVLPKDDGKARSLVHLCIFLLLGVCLITGLTIPLARPIAQLFNAPDLADFWWLMPFSILGMGLWNILNYWYIRRSAFTRAGGYQMTQSVLNASGKISFGALGWLKSGMIIATVCAPLLSLLISISLAWKKHIRQLLSFDRLQLKAVAREYANFPKFSLPRALVNTLSLSLPIWILTPYFGLDSIGRFSLAMVASAVPLGLIARACNQVLFQRVSELVQKKLGLRHTLNTFLLWMGGCIVVVMTVVYVLLPQLVSVLFGAEWLESATIIRHLYPYLILTPICGSICFLPDVFAKQQTALWMETAYTIALAVVLAIGVHTTTFLTNISLFALTKFVYLAVQLVWFLKLVRDYNKSL